MKPPDYDWFVKHWPDSAQVQLLDSDAVFAFKRKVEQRAEEVGRGDAETLVGHCLYRALYEADRFGATTTILDAIAPPTFKTGHLSPVHLEGRAVADATGTFPSLGISAFWAPWAFNHDRDRFDRLCDFAAINQIDYVRWFGAHDWPGGTDPGEANYADTVALTIEALAEFGVRSQITLATRRHMINDVFDFGKLWGEIVTHHREAVILVEMVNEWNHADNGWADDDVRRMADGYAYATTEAHVPFALSGAAGATWADKLADTDRLYDRHSYMLRSPVRTAHFPRAEKSEGPWRFVRQPWHAKDWPFCVNNEPQRWDKCSDGSRGGRSVEVAAASPIVAWICNCGMSCHHDAPGVIPSAGHYDENTEIVGHVWNRVLPELPRNLANWRPTRVGGAWNGPAHPFPSLEHQQWTDAGNDSGRGVSRSFAAVADRGRFVMALIGVRQSVTLEEHQDHAYRVYSLRHGEQVYAGQGPNVTLRGSDAFVVVST